MKISVCIPTYKRPDLFLIALNSCINQTRVPDQIFIGDDSPDKETEKLVKKISRDFPVKLSYHYHGPTTTVNENTTILINKVDTEFLVLLHDDDSLLPNAIEDLSNCFIEDPTIDVAYGKQYVLTNEGILKLKASEDLNNYYFRTEEYEGNKLLSLEAAFLQQFPNNGFMIKTAIAKKVGYKSVAGDACDLDFALRLALDNRKFYFLNKFTANYRMSADALSINSNGNGSINAYGLVENLQVPKQSIKFKRLWMKRKAPFAIANAAKRKDLKRAFEIYFGKWHRSSIPTFNGIKQLTVIFFYYFLLKFKK